MAVSTNDPSPESQAQEIQDYINQISAQYEAAENLIQEEVNDSGQIDGINAQLQAVIQAFLKLGVILTPQDIQQLETDLMNGDTAAYNQLVASIQNSIPIVYQRLYPNVVQHWMNQLTSLVSQAAPLQAALNQAKEQLEAIDPEMKDLDDALASLQNNLLTQQGLNPSQLASDMSYIQKYLQTLQQAMIAKLQADKYQAIIQDDTDGNLSDAQLEQLTAEMIQAQGQEQAVFNGLFNTLTTDFQTFNTDYNNANIDLHSYNIFQEWFGDADEKEDEDKAIMRNATAMMTLLGDLITDITPEVASLMPEMEQVTMILQTILKRIEKILEDPNLAPTMKLGEMLSLLMFALGIFEQMSQQVQSEKTKNQQGLSKANMTASQMNLDTAFANQKIQQEEAEQASLMQKLSLGLQIVGGAIMALLAPGLGTAALIALVTTLEATGVIDDLTDKLGSAIGSQIGADAIMGGIEIGVTAGGGFALDQAVNSAAQALLRSAVEAAEQTVEQTIEEAAAQAAKQVGAGANQAAAETTIENVVDKAANRAAENTIKAFLKQPAINLLGLFAKRTFFTSLREAVAKTAEEAAQNAVADSALIAELAARNATITQQDILTVANRSADEAVANTSSLSLDQTQKLGMSDLQLAGSRALWTLAYFMVSNKDLANQTDSLFGSNLAVLMQVIRSLAQMLIMAGGTGVIDTASFANINNFTRLANLLNAIPQAGNTAAAIGSYDISESQAGAVEAITKTDGMGDLLQMFLDQIQKDSKATMDAFTSGQQQQAQTLQSMSGHLYDGDRAGIQVLVSGAA